MPPTKKFPCDTTRCFNEKIHPKKLKPNIYIATFRLQIRKHPKSSWRDVCETLAYRTTKEWEKLFRIRSICSIKGRTLVSTWRMMEGRTVNDIWVVRMPGTKDRFYSSNGEKYKRIKDTAVAENMKGIFDADTGRRS